MFSNLKLLHYSKHSSYRKNRLSGNCSVCGHLGKFIRGRAIDDDLYRTWKINKTQRKYIDERETLKCEKCGASLRIRNMAKALLLVEKGGCKDIKCLAQKKEFLKKNIAEINNCGALHSYIKNLSNLKYSEYNPSFKGKVKHQDIQNLSYQNNFFDYVLTSDTLEHVPDLDKALNEVYRVLKPGGYHIFTVPLLPSRKKTLKRAEIRNKELKLLEEKSYHGQSTEDYLVFNEFGLDFIDRIKKQNYQVLLYFCNMIYNDHSFVFVTRKRHERHRGKINT